MIFRVVCFSLAVFCLVMLNGQLPTRKQSRMNEQHGVSKSDLLLIFLLLAGMLLVIGLDYQSQLYDLQRRVAVLEQRK